MMRLDLWTWPLPVVNVGPNIPLLLTQTHNRIRSVTGSRRLAVLSSRIALSLGPRVS